MKQLSKLHAEAVLKAKTEQEKIKAADEQAVIEVMCELQEAKEAATKAERQRIVNLLMIQHEAAKEMHNYWQVAANLIQAETGETT